MEERVIPFIFEVALALGLGLAAGARQLNVPREAAVRPAT